MSKTLPDREVARAEEGDETHELAVAVEDGLLDRVIQRIHHTGLRLARANTTDNVEIRAAIDEMNALLHDVAMEVLEWRSARPGPHS